ncbi:MAG TPA: hypothetical protein V6D06_03270 [Trichocoleus sp.]
MSPLRTPSQADTRYLALLERSRKKAITALGGCFLTVLCLLLVANSLQRTYNREPLSRGYDVIGLLLGASGFVTVLGGGLSTWLAIDTTTEYRRIKREQAQERLER